MTRSVKELGLPSPEERRRLREAADLTHEQVAGVMGVAPATVRSWESGRTDPRGRKRTLYARLLVDLGAPGSDAEEADGQEAHGQEAHAEEAHAEEAHAEAAPEAAHPQEQEATAAEAREDGAARGSSLRAIGSVRASAGGGQGRQAGAPGTRPKPAAKRAAKPPAALTRHETKTPVRTGAGSANGTGSGSHDLLGPAPATEPDRTPAEPPQPPQPPAEPNPDALVPPSEPEPEPEQAQAQLPEAEADAEPEAADDAKAEPDAGAAPGPPATVAFDALWDRAAGALTRQAYLLTGRRALAHEAVERAFQQAWAQWPAVATDPDPVGWVRAATYEYALSPWHRLRRSHRNPPAQEKPPADPADRIILDAMLGLHPTHRRTVLLYDGVGLDLPDTAAETEASTPTTAHRLLNAHEELSELIPELVDVPPEKQSALLHERFTALRPAVRLVPRPAAEVRLAGENRARRWTRAVLGLTAVIAVATTYTVTTAPREYEPPRAPGSSVSGVPPHSGPQRLTERSKELQDKLRADPATSGPGRLVPRGE
ncbi:helix-turn-helix domain-containing protein [Streptomyces xanthophaeus]|uniref:helix-turn-helix domain-containing protein n=1 Tax=Streptomyces xanthophaeus TaxID=67385 RepID=UPI00371B1066